MNINTTFMQSDAHFLKPWCFNHIPTYQALNGHSDTFQTHALILHVNVFNIVFKIPRQTRFYMLCLLTQPKSRHDTFQCR